MRDEHNPPSYAGHRGRLREKFSHSKGKALSDYEVLELFLFFFIPYRDTKPLAKRLLKDFGSFAGIAAAEEEMLLLVPGLGPNTALALKVYGEMVLRQARQSIERRPLLNCWNAVMEYLQASDAYKATEDLHVLFLDKRYHLITDEILFVGTVDQTPFYIRDILKRALALNAVFLIVVHNHPSGDVLPSAADIDQTKLLYTAAQNLGITLLDHFIVAKTAHTSLRTIGVLPGDVL